MATDCAYENDSLNINEEMALKQTIQQSKDGACKGKIFFPVCLFLLTDKKSLLNKIETLISTSTQIMTAVFVTELEHQSV